MDIELHEWPVADATKAVHLASLDHENVSGTRLERLSVHRVLAAPLTDELNLIVGMAVRSWAAARLPVEEKHGDASIPLVRADELVRASPEGKILLTNAMHWLTR